MKHALALIAFALTASSASAATLVTNGSFEDPGTFSGNFTTVNAGSTYLSGWSVLIGSVDLINTYWQPASGAYSLDLAGNSPGIISQTVNGLKTGAKYVLSFAMAGNPDGGPVVKTVLAGIGSTSDSFSFDTTGKTHSDMGWQTKTLAFVAEGTSMTLSFGTSERGPYGPALDSISIEPAAVPLPAAGLMLAGALAATGLVRRKRG